MKLRGSTDFSFTSPLSVDLLSTQIEDIVRRFVHETEIVRSGTVTHEGHEFTIALVINTSSFGVADEAMLSLSAALRAQLTPQGDVIEEHATELVPA